MRDRQFLAAALAVAFALAAPAVGAMVTLGTINTAVNVDTYAEAQGWVDNDWNSGATSASTNSMREASLWSEQEQRTLLASASASISGSIEEVWATDPHESLPIPGRYVSRLSATAVSMAEPPLSASALAEGQISISGSLTVDITAQQPEGEPVEVFVGAMDGGLTPGWSLSIWSNGEQVGEVLGPDLPAQTLELVAGQTVSFYFYHHASLTTGMQESVIDVAVPEPATLSLLALGFLALRRRS